MIDQLKQRLRDHIGLAEKATKGPWRAGPWEGEEAGPSWDVEATGIGIAYTLLPRDAAFIASARTESPANARALLVAIEAFDRMANMPKIDQDDEHRLRQGAKDALARIAEVLSTPNARNAMSEELKACPFCGIVPAPMGAFAYCRTQGCASQFRKTLIHEWNTRADSPELAQLRAEVTKLKEGEQILWSQLSERDEVNAQQRSTATARIAELEAEVADARAVQQQYAAERATALEALAGERRRIELSKATASEVWATHEKQFADQQEKLDAANARIAELEKERDEAKAQATAFCEKWVQLEAEVARLREDSFERIHADYLEWVKATFPDETIYEQAGHLHEELTELVDSDWKDTSEFADVLMLLCCIAHGQGVDIFAAFRPKFAVNKARTWVKTDKGFRHEKPAAIDAAMSAEGK